MMTPLSIGLLTVAASSWLIKPNLRRLVLTIIFRCASNELMYLCRYDSFITIIASSFAFQQDIIPTYFGNAIVFASFLRKLQRWGFVRVSSKRSGRYEFSSPTFKRIDSSAPAASAASGAATTTNAAVNDGGGGGASIRSPQQQQQQQQQVMVQRNQQPVPAPNQLPRRADASDIADLTSNIQRQRSTQQPSTSSPQSGPNQYSNQMNIADVNNVLQHIIGGLLSGQNSVPNQQPVPNYTSQLNNVAGNNHLQSLQQWQHPYPALNLLNSALQSLTRGPTPSAQAMGQYPPLSAQSSAVHALMSLSGMVPQSPILNTTPVALGMSTPASSQPNDITHVLSLLQMLQRVVEEEYQRKAQVEAMQNAIMETIGRILGQGFHNNNIAQPQQVSAPPPSRQSFGSNNNIAAQPNQERAPQPSIGSNVQADSIATILLAAQRGDATAQPEETAIAQSFGPVINKFDSEDDSDEDSEEDEHQSTSAKKRKSSPDDEDQYDADDDSWNERLRPRRKSPP